MKTFEYLVKQTSEFAGDWECAERHINSLGADGWELCGICGIGFNCFIFKREKAQ